MRPEQVHSTLKATRRIDGWFAKNAAMLFGLLDEAQGMAQVAGDVFEIGVHHGKSAVLLGRMLRGGEHMGVCDTFGANNPSESGSGDRSLFDANMARLAPDAHYEVFPKLSSELTAAEIGGPFRIFHVDGGHLVEEALGDLDLAARTLTPRGLIAVDDPFRAEWPGVTEAILDFCGRNDFEPVVLGFNKLVLARSADRGLYDSALTDHEWDYFDRVIFKRKDLPIAGADTAIYFTPSARQPPESLSRPFAVTGHLSAKAKAGLDSRRTGRRH